MAEQLSLKSTAAFLKAMLRAPDQQRHLGEWFRSQAPSYLLERKLPWLVYDAVDYLRVHIERVSQPLQVFEYGSGGSTLFFNAVAAHCVSIEEDSNWFAQVSERIDRSRVDLRLVLPEVNADSGGDPADPAAFLSDDARYRGYSFRRYVEQIDNFPRGHFDIVLVDGRARPSCIAHAAPKVKNAGLLVLDNADRDYYTEKTATFLRNFSRLSFVGITPGTPSFSRTDIYKRIADD